MLTWRERRSALSPDQGKCDKEWAAAFGALVFPIGNVCISPKTCTRRPFSVTEPCLGIGKPKSLGIGKPKGLGGCRKV